ncbi:MAG: hypothetical protein ACLTTH_07730 [Holdemanella porci]
MKNRKQTLTSLAAASMVLDTGWSNECICESGRDYEGFSQIRKQLWLKNTEGIIRRTDQEYFWIW